MASHLHSEWPSSVFSSPREHRDATRLLKSDRGDVTHPANAGWSYGRKRHLSGLCLRLCYKVPLPMGDDHCLSLIFFRGRNLLLKSSWKFSVVQVYRRTKTSQCIN